MGHGDQSHRAGRAHRVRSAEGKSPRSFTRAGDAKARSLTHLPDARPEARSTGDAWALLPDTAPAAAGAPGPESRGWYRSRQSGYRTRAQGDVHRGRRAPGKASPSSPAANSASREQHRASLSPLPPGPSPEASPKQRPGFRRLHPAPSLLGLRHLVGGGKNTMRTRKCRRASR